MIDHGFLGHADLVFEPLSFMDHQPGWERDAFPSRDGVYIGVRYVHVQTGLLLHIDRVTQGYHAGLYAPSGGEFSIVQSAALSPHFEGIIQWFQDMVHQHITSAQEAKGEN